MEENEPLHSLSRNNHLETKCKQALLQFQEYLNKNNSGFCKQQFQLLSQVQNATIEEQDIYNIYLCTLAEQRWTTKRTRPYSPKDICSNDPVGDIWKDYEIDTTPKTTILDKPQSLTTLNLDKTCKQEECPQCRNIAQNPCSICKGQGSVISYIQLNVQWRNTTSSLSFSSNNSNSYPRSIMETETNKIKCLDFDGIWPENRKTLDHLLDTCDNLPQGLRTMINQAFSVHQKANIILRLKCTIERLHIQVIHFQLNKFPNDTFTFYRTGENNRLYIDPFSSPPTNQLHKTGCILL